MKKIPLQPTLIGLLAVLAVGSAILILKTPAAVAPSPNVEQALPLVAIESISIEPSVMEDGWIMYAQGAKVVVKGDYIDSVVIRYFPTGTGIGELYPEGEKLGEATRDPADPRRWTIDLPSGLTTTHMWAVASGGGQQMPSIILNNVGFRSE